MQLSLSINIFLKVITNLYQIDVSYELLQINVDKWLQVKLSEMWLLSEAP